MEFENEIKINIRRSLVMKDEFRVNGKREEENYVKRRIEKKEKKDITQT